MHGMPQTWPFATLASARRQHLDLSVLVIRMKLHSGQEGWLGALDHHHQNDQAAGDLGLVLAKVREYACNMT